MKRVLGAALITALIMFGCQTSELSEEEKLLEVLSKAVISEPVTITFDEGYVAGDLIEVVAPGGCAGEITIYAENPDFPGQNAAMIFDSNNPTGEDIDLGTPNQQFGGPGVSDSSSDGNEASNDTAQNNLLIITEDFDSADPDDSFVEGSYYEINFSGYGSGSVTMDSFLMIDLDGESKGEGTIVRLYDEEDNLLLEKEIMPMNDNGKQLIDLEGTQGVVRMVLHLNNSGAIDDLKFHCENGITGCETMFAKDNEGLCFNDTDPAFERWGWTNPLEEGFEGKLELWAGAGQCDTGKGAKVGYLHVTYSEGTLKATYDMMDGFYITETHFYAGKDLYPLNKDGRPTVAPGQYPGKNEKLDYAKEDSYTVDGLSGAIYLIAHGKVCGNFADDDYYDDENEDD